MRPLIRPSVRLCSGLRDRLLGRSRCCLGIRFGIRQRGSSTKIVIGYLVLLSIERFLLTTLTCLEVSESALAGSNWGDCKSPEKVDLRPDLHP